MREIRPSGSVRAKACKGLATRPNHLVYKVAGAAGTVGIVVATLGWHSLSELEEKVQLDAQNLAKMTSGRVIDQHVEELGGKTRELTEASADLRATMKSLGSAAGTIRPVIDGDGTVGCADGYRLVMLVDHSQFKVINGDNVHQQYVVDAKGVWR